MSLPLRKYFTLGHEELSFTEFYTPLAEMVGRVPQWASLARLKRIERMALRVSRVVAPAVELARGLAWARRMSSNRAVYSSERARTVFGFAPQMNWFEGMLVTELWLREHEGVAGRLQWNCGRHYAMRPTALVRPRNEFEVSASVRRARLVGKRVKAWGKLYTFVPLPDTDGVAGEPGVDEPRTGCYRQVGDGPRWDYLAEVD
ncbi:MAG: hypothetical protein J6386_26100 [Candidatus Synoicihabitans palmerolidicus]|nr:hypothetical protein [Candidatus Synoicihabitans palmerolidicus]MCC5025937.1 hypothetical protein [Candidatus Synoicihabitans palmerolidicus]MCC5025976.1 hypothetical protein [Candidatus Synoicihabitans palmerolidicus]MCC5026020.1 hypothetical protein [Candidatus Synoicihabitans palmerolidicus]MCC5026052.1 hypothetical protein [Candidatus Synoicihabitans palmerolidicus]